jgi:hypothetical protein
MHDAGYRINPKSEARNPKTISKSKYSMFKTLLTAGQFEFFVYLNFGHFMEFVWDLAFSA